MSGNADIKESPREVGRPLSAVSQPCTQCWLPLPPILRTLESGLNQKSGGIANYRVVPRSTQMTWGLPQPGIMDSE